MAEKDIKTIYQRLSAVQQELKAPKSQRNNFGNYNYRSAEDILEAAKPVLKEQGLTLVISDEIIHIPSGHNIQVVEMTNEKGKEYSEIVGGDRFYIKAVATVFDSEGEAVSATALAREGQNKRGMDDSQITGAASSYARKYALNGLFNIDDTKDADTDEHHQQSSKPAKATTAPSRPTPQPAPARAATPTPSAKPANTYSFTGDDGVEVEMVPCEVPGCRSGVRLKWYEYNKKQHEGHTICRTHSENGDWKTALAGDGSTSSDEEVDPDMIDAINESFPEYANYRTNPDGSVERE